MKSQAPITAVVVGLVLIALGMLTQQVVPALGRVAYQAAAAGSYSPATYRLNLTWYYVVAGIVIALGLGVLVADLKSKRD